MAAKIIQDDAGMALPITQNQAEQLALALATGVQSLQVGQLTLRRSASKAVTLVGPMFAFVWLDADDLLAQLR